MFDGGQAFDIIVDVCMDETNWSIAMIQRVPFYALAWIHPTKIPRLREFPCWGLHSARGQNRGVPEVYKNVQCLCRRQMLLGKFKIIAGLTVTALKMTTRRSTGSSLEAIVEVTDKAHSTVIKFPPRPRLSSCYPLHQCAWNFCAV